MATPSGITESHLAKPDLVGIGLSSNFLTNRLVLATLFSGPKNQKQSINPVVDEAVKIGMPVKASMAFETCLSCHARMTTYSNASSRDKMGYDGINIQHDHMWFSPEIGMGPPLMAFFSPKGLTEIGLPVISHNPKALSSCIP